MEDRNLQEQFSGLRQEFLNYTGETELLPGEMEETTLFFQAPAVKGLIAFGAENNEFLDRIVDTFAGINDMDIYRGCLTGYLIGLYGESNIIAKQTDLALTAFFQKILGLCEAYMELACDRLGTSPEKMLEDEELLNRFYEFPPQSLFEKAPEPVKAWMGISMLSLGVMSRICCMRPLRDELRAGDHIAQRCEFLGDYRDTVGFVPGILNMVEQETVLLLSPGTGSGVEVSLEEIDSNNVFFTLLQFTLYHEGLLKELGAQGFEYREVVERIALHEPVDDEEWPENLYESGCFGYYTYPALNRDGSYNEMGAVWGEGTLHEVPKLDGRYVILLTKPSIHRSWGNAFVSSTHSQLLPRVKLIRRLPEDEAARWLEKVYKANQSQL